MLRTNEKETAQMYDQTTNATNLARWKGSTPPPGGWMLYDHKAKP